MSTNTGMPSCCLSGSVHSGNPTGREDTIAGIYCYVAEPSDKSTSTSIVFLTDIFGWKFKNVRLLADNIANAGLYRYVPNVFDGDALPEEFLQSIEPPTKTKEGRGIVDKTKGTVDVMATLGSWLAKHREGVIEPVIQ